MTGRYRSDDRRGMSRSFLSSSAALTTQWGESLGKLAEDGDVICLTGELGAGKTTFAQGIARGLGITVRVTSPTFTIMQQYAGRLRLYHLDCYRLAGASDLEELGPEDWLGRDGVAVIEWAERVLPALPLDRLDVRLHSEGEARIIHLAGRGPRGQQLADFLMGIADEELIITPAHSGGAL